MNSYLAVSEKSNNQLQEGLPTMRSKNLRANENITFNETDLRSYSALLMEKKIDYYYQIGLSDTT